MKMTTRGFVILAASLSTIAVLYYGQKWWKSGGGSWGDGIFGGRRYVDSQDFVDKYVRDDIKGRLDGFSAKWGFADVKLTNVKSELQTGYGMPIEKITCDVTLVPRNGSEHYVLTPWPGADEDRKKTLSGMLHGHISGDGAVTNIISAEWQGTASKRADAMRTSLEKSLISNPVKAPIGVPLKAKDLAGIFVATVYRAKDGEGVYRPVKSGGMQDELIEYESKLRCSFNWRRAGNPFGDSLVTAERLKELGGVSFADNEGVCAIRTAYNTHVGDFTAAFAELVKMSEEYNIIVRNRIGDHFLNNRFAWQDAVNIIKRARNRLSDARRDMSKCKDEIRIATNMLGSRKRDLAEAEKKLPQTIVNAEKERAKLAETRKTYGDSGRYVMLAKSWVQSAERSERDCRAQIGSLRKKIEMLEARIATTRDQLERASTACASAETDLKKTESEQRERLEVAMKDAAKRMDAAWEAIAMPSRQTRW